MKKCFVALLFLFSVIKIYSQYQPISPSSPNGLGYITNPVPVANGGTNQTALVTTATASKIPSWDANANLSANNILPTQQTITTTTTQTLTVSSPLETSVTASASITYQLPVTSTLVAGQAYTIMNTSATTSVVITVISSGGNTICTLFQGAAATFKCILTSGTSATSWTISTFTPSNVISIATTSTITGLTSLTVQQIQFVQIAPKIIDLTYYIQGTSSGTSLQFTVPFTENASYGLRFACIGIDSGVGISGRQSIDANTSTVYFYSGVNTTTWTNSGLRSAQGQLTVFL